MIKQVLFITTALLIANAATAKEVREVRIFQNDATLVRLDTHFEDGVPITVHNMDDRVRAKKRLNDMVSKRVGTVRKKEHVEDAYRQAFSEILNGPEWTALKADIQTSLIPVSNAMKYRIKKLPAIVFNDGSVVYGVQSLKEAAQIYERSGGAQ